MASKCRGRNREYRGRANRLARASPRVVHPDGSPPFGYNLTANIKYRYLSCRPRITFPSLDMHPLRRSLANAVTSVKLPLSSIGARRVDKSFNPSPVGEYPPQKPGSNRLARPNCQTATAAKPAYLPVFMTVWRYAVDCTNVPKCAQMRANGSKYYATQRATGCTALGCCGSAFAARSDPLARAGGTAHTWRRRRPPARLQSALWAH